MAGTCSKGLSSELDTEDVRQLWSLACLLAQEDLTAQTAKCLEPLCAVNWKSRSTEEQEIILRANVLLGEICSVVCSNSRKADDRELWTRRVIQIEKCIYAVDAAVEQGVSCSHENKLRLLKIKFLLQQQLKVERTAKNQRMLEILCEGLKCCAESEGIDLELVAEFRKYFGVKLKACLVKMHAATVMAKYAKDNNGVCSFVDNLKYVRTTLPNYVDTSFLLWLVVVTCHTAISSFVPGNTAEMRQLIDFSQKFFDKAILEQPVSPAFHMHHLIITGFYYIRTGRLTKVSPVLEQIQTLIRGTESDDNGKPVGVMKEAYLNTILNSLRVYVVASSDPKAAAELALNTIHSAQTDLKTYAQYPAVRQMLIATLFDMLHVYCRLQGLQCRYADMGATIVQMTTLFATYKVDLARTIFYSFFLARCHTLIAKYATAIGNVKMARSHLNYVVDKLLPAPTVEESSYPDAYLAVWVEVLEVATYCCGVATSSSFGTNGGNPTGVEIEHIYPSRVLLEWVARILKSEGLRHHICQCCSVELRAKYDLALAKWMWATDNLSNSAVEEEGDTAYASRFTQHAELEELRPNAFTLLHESLQRMNTSVTCCETTSEIMVLFGPKVKQGESMQMNAIKSSVHTKNVLLQTRLLANLFELYTNKGSVELQATVATQYEKKLAVLQRRIAAAQTEGVTIAALTEWTAGSVKVTTPSHGIRAIHGG